MKWLKILAAVFGLYFAYLLVGGALIFAINGHSEFCFTDYDVESFFSSDVSQDRIALIEDRAFALTSRINLITSAQEELDIVYFAIAHGETTDLFFAAVLESANRGVKVNILLDGLAHNFKGTAKDTLYSLVDHPNIDVKFYEPLDLFKPWTWNNRLHDKFILVDNKYLMLGGRNLGDKFFLEDYSGEIVEDRDVVVVNTLTDDVEDSVIREVREYFTYIWSHEYSQALVGNLSDANIRRGTDRSGLLEDKIEEFRRTQPHLFANIDWHTLSLPTKKISFIHNPVTRLNKEPWVLEHITKLMEEAEDQILIQSPYLVPNKPMQRNFTAKEINAPITVVTNSVAASPNLFGMAGYLKHRRDIADSTALYEYQGEGSLHAKTYIIDDYLSIIGSFNADARSAFLSTEIMLVVDSEEFAQVLLSAVDELMAQSLEVGADYNYIDNPNVPVRKSSLDKRILVRLLYYVFYPLDFLL